MTRLKLEAIFHTSDDPKDHKVLADQLQLMLNAFVDPGKSRNRTPHYDSVTISVERKDWTPVS